jgi:hypothetical protein
VDEIANKALVMGAKGFETGFIPKARTSSGTASSSTTARKVIEFTAPAKPGDYPYMCSFPGHSIHHARLMLHVKCLPVLSHPLVSAWLSLDRG